MFALFLSYHDASCCLQIDLLPPRAELLVCFHQLLPDRDALRTMLFALAALHTQRSICRCHPERDGLEIFEPSGTLILGIHMVIAGEDRRNINTLGTRHAVSATRAVYLGALNDI